MRDVETEAPSQCDVVIIGGGIGGLTAGAVLAKSGLSTVVCEAQPVAGGYICGFRRNGFIFDSAIEWLNQCGPEGFVSRIFSHIDTDFPKCRPLGRAWRYKGAGFDYVLDSNPLALRDRLAEDFPDDAAGIRRFFADMQKFGTRLDILNNRIRALPTMGLLERVLLGLKMLHWVLPVRKYLNASAEEGLGWYVRGPSLKTVFCRETAFMAIAVPVAWAFNGDFQLPPQGGSEAFVSWLCDKIRGAGSRVLVNRRVEKVLVDGKRGACGVSMEDGQSLRSKYVVAACDVRTLYEEMLPSGSVPRKLRSAVKSADVYDSHFSIYLGLDCDPASFGLGEEMVCVMRGDVERDDHSACDPDTVALTVISPSVRDPSVAPPGKGIVTIHCTATMDYEDAWRTEAGSVRGNAYRELKRAFAERLLDRVEEALLPGLRQHIEVMEIATPITFERYTGNSGGTIMGTRPTARNIHAGVSGPCTPVANLFLAGHWADYGGGVPIAVRAGGNAGLMILKERNRKEYERLRDAMDGRA